MSGLVEVNSGLAQRLYFLHCVRRVTELPHLKQMPAAVQSNNLTVYVWPGLGEG